MRDPGVGAVGSSLRALSEDAIESPFDRGPESVFEQHELLEAALNDVDAVFEVDRVSTDGRHKRIGVGRGV